MAMNNHQGMSKKNNPVIPAGLRIVRINNTCPTSPKTVKLNSNVQFASPNTNLMLLRLPSQNKPVLLQNLPSSSSATGSIKFYPVQKCQKGSKVIILTNAFKDAPSSSKVETSELDACTEMPTSSREDPDVEVSKPATGIPSSSSGGPQAEVSESDASTEMPTSSLEDPSMKIFDSVFLTRTSTGVSIFPLGPKAKVSEPADILADVPTEVPSSSIDPEAEVSEPDATIEMPTSSVEDTNMEVSEPDDASPVVPPVSLKSEAEVSETVRFTSSPNDENSNGDKVQNEAIHSTTAEIPSENPEIHQHPSPHPSSSISSNPQKREDDSEVDALPKQEMLLLEVEKKEMVIEDNVEESSEVKVERKETVKEIKTEDCSKEIMEGTSQKQRETAATPKKESSCAHQFFCRSIRIGSFRIYPQRGQEIIPVTVCNTTIEFEAPAVHDEDVITRIVLKKEDIDMVIANFRYHTRILFILATPACGENIRNQLYMIQHSSNYFCPEGTKDHQKLITFLIRNIPAECEHHIRTVFPAVGVLKEVSEEMANRILVKSTLKPPERKSDKKTVVPSLVNTISAAPLYLAVQSGNTATSSVVRGIAPCSVNTASTTPLCFAIPTGKTVVPAAAQSIPSGPLNAASTTPTLCFAIPTGKTVAPASPQSIPSGPLNAASTTPTLCFAIPTGKTVAPASPQSIATGPLNAASTTPTLCFAIPTGKTVAPAATQHIAPIPVATSPLCVPVSRNTVASTAAPAPIASITSSSLNAASTTPTLCFAIPTGKTVTPAAAHHIAPIPVTTTSLCVPVGNRNTVASTAVPSIALHPVNAASTTPTLCFAIPTGKTVAPAAVHNIAPIPVTTTPLSVPVEKVNTSTASTAAPAPTDNIVPIPVATSPPCVVVESKNTIASTAAPASKPTDIQKAPKKANSPCAQVAKIMSYPPPPQPGVTITSTDLACLNEGVSLNDAIIDFYLKYLVNERLSEKDRKRTHVFSSFFYLHLTQDISNPKKESSAVKRHNRVSTWTKNVDIFEKDFIVVPINQNMHWFLVIICFPWVVPANSGLFKAPGKARGIFSYVRSTSHKPNTSDKTPCILIFDSMSLEVSFSVLKILREYLEIEWYTKKGTTCTFPSDVMRGHMINVPQQTNCTDCGLFLLQYVESFFENPLVFDAKLMPDLRNWFSRVKVAKKRSEIRELICDLQRQQLCSSKVRKLR